ncbi:MAG: TetR/AcrR family transcriptional regulator [Smithellaceae bacterium]|nr:TetR/AcrR family transcriptional regulator [Smithellaceae bacterium]
MLQPKSLSASLCKANRKRMIDNRQNIINATECLLQTKGLTRLTTREIAREANVAEGLIYHHFKDKAGLIYEVVAARFNETSKLLQNLPLQVGTRTLPEILEDVFYAIYSAHYETVLMICSIFSDRQLMTQMRKIIEERNLGPRRANEGLQVFLEAEQRMGRFSVNADPATATKCLQMISLQAAMDDKLMGYTFDASRVRREIRGYVQLLMTGIEPHPAIPKPNALRKMRKK